MKKALALSAVAAFVCTPLFSYSQSSAPAASPEPSAVASMARQRPGITPLTPDERDALKAASQKAQQDPDYKAAKEKLDVAQKAAFDAISAKDKTFAPIAEKIEAAAAASKGASLTQDEATQARAAMDTLKDTPEGEAFQKARMDFVAVLRKAMVAADPSVAPILEKISQNRSMMGSAPKPSASPAASAQ